MNTYCHYYQASTEPKKSCIVAALMRSCEHMAFDRTYDTKTNTLEFFVPADQDAQFRAFMQLLISKDLISNLVQMPNRLEHGQRL